MRMILSTLLLSFFMFAACSDESSSIAQTQNLEKIAAERAKKIKERMAAENKAAEARRIAEQAAEKAAHEKMRAERRAADEAAHQARLAEEAAKKSAETAKKAAAEQALIQNRNVFTDKEKRIKIVVKDVIVGETALKKGLIDKDTYNHARINDNEILHTVISFTNNSIDEILVDPINFELQSSKGKSTDPFPKKSVAKGETKEFEVYFTLSSLVYENCPFRFNQKINDKPEEYIYTERKKYNVDLKPILDKHLTPVIVDRSEYNDEISNKENRKSDKKNLITVELKEVLGGVAAEKRLEHNLENPEYIQASYFVFSIKNVGYFRDIYLKNIHARLIGTDHDAIYDKNKIIPRGKSALYEFYVESNVGAKDHNSTDDLERLKKSTLRLSLDAPTNYAATFKLYDYGLFRNYVDKRISDVNDKIKEWNSVDRNPENYVLMMSPIDLPEYMHGILLGENTNLPCKPEIAEYPSLPYAFINNDRADVDREYIADYIATARGHLTCSVSKGYKELNLFFSGDGSEVVAANIHDSVQYKDGPEAAMKKMLKLYGEPDYYYQAEDKITALYGTGFRVNENYGDDNDIKLVLDVKGKFMAITVKCRKIESCTSYRIYLSMVDLANFWKANKKVSMRRR